MTQFLFIIYMFIIYTSVFWYNIINIFIFVLEIYIENIEFAKLFNSKYHGTFSLIIYLNIFHFFF